ncbi:MAG: hypothetical protein H8D54_03000, partial [Candidatus Omnitrophica bacterium]|nr:hypothetical protein [Candidatus Omnitrophota bacterium]
DGFGLGTDDDTNPFNKISLPNLKRLYTYATRQNKSPPLFGGAPFKGKVLYSGVHAASKELGLGNGQPGDSSVGHAAMARAAYIRSYLSRIWGLVDTDQLAEQPAIKKAIDNVLSSIKSGNTNAKLHLSAMISLGYIHSDIRIFYEILKICKEAGLKGNQVVIHAITDGKDVFDKTSTQYIKELEAVMKRLGVGVIGTIQGRDWIGNRDPKFLKVWTDFGAKVIMEGKGAVSFKQLEAIKKIDSKKFVELTPEEQDEIVADIISLGEMSEPESALEMVKRCEEIDLVNMTGSQDRFILPTHIKGVDSAIESGDSFVHLAVRQDRSVLFPQYYIFPEVEKGNLKDFIYSTLIPFSGVKSPECHLSVLNELDIVGESAPVLYAKYGMEVHSQAESEKGNEVTNAMIVPSRGELSEHVAGKLFMDNGKFPVSPTSPRDDPDMKAEEIINNVVTDLEKGSINEIFNVCNLDVIGHYGDKVITAKASKTVDENIGRLVEYCQENNIILFIFSDHGCSERLDPMHTENQVPFMVIFPEGMGEGWVIGEGVKALTDIEPTRMKLYNIAQPTLITGDPILIPDMRNWNDRKVLKEILIRAAYNDFSLLRRGPREQVKNAVNLLLEYKGTGIFNLFNEKLGERIEILCKAQSPFITEFLDRLPRREFSKYFKMYQESIRLRYLSPEDRLPKPGEVFGWARRVIDYPGVLTGYRIVNYKDWGAERFNFSPFADFKFPSIEAIEQDFIKGLRSYCEKFTNFNRFNYRALDIIAEGTKNEYHYKKCISKCLHMLSLYKSLMPEDPDIDTMTYALYGFQEDPSLPLDQVERWINKIHQRLLSNFFTKKCEFSPLANRMKDRVLQRLDFGNGNKFNIIDLNNFEDFSNSAAGIFIESLVNLSEDVTAKPEINIISSGKEAWIYIDTSPHASEIYVNLTNPSLDGMIHFNWFENVPSSGFNNYSRLSIMDMMLKKEGFSVERFGTKSFDEIYEEVAVHTEPVITSEGMALRARLDKSLGPHSIETLSDKLRMLSRIVVAMKNIDTIFELPSLEDKRNRENYWIHGSLSDYFRALGGLPGTVRYGSVKLSSNMGVDFVGRFNIFKGKVLKESKNLKNILNEELKRLDLPLIDIEDDYLRQEDIDRYFNRPIIRAVNSGKLILEGETLVNNPSYKVENTLERMCDILNDDSNVTLLRDTARIANSLRDFIPFEEVGFIEGRCVRKATLELLDRRIQFYCLSNKEGELLLAYAFTGDELYSLDENNNIVRDVKELEDRLKDYHYRIEEADKKTKDKKIRWKNISILHVADIVKGASVDGVVASAGRTTAPLKLKRSSSSPGFDYTGYIFASEKLGMDDVNDVKTSKGFVTVSGSILSHPFISAREKGNPGIVLDKAEMTKDGLKFKYKSFDEKIYSYKGKQIVYYDNISTHAITAQDGDVVTIDTKRGILSVIGASHDPAPDFRMDVKKVYKILGDLSSHIENTEALKELVVLLNAKENIHLLEFVLQEFLMGDLALGGSERRKAVEYIIGSSVPLLKEGIKNYLKDLHYAELENLKEIMHKAEISLKKTSFADEVLYKEKEVDDHLYNFKSFVALISPYVDFKIDLSSMEADFRNLTDITERRLNNFRKDILREIKKALPKINSIDLRDLHRLQKRAEFLSLDIYKEKEFQEFLLLIEKKQHEFEHDFIRSNQRYVVNLKNAGTHLKRFTGNKAAELGNLLNRELTPNIFIENRFVLTPLGIRKIF